MNQIFLQLSYGSYGNHNHSKKQQQQYNFYTNIMWLIITAQQQLKQLTNQTWA